VASLAPVGRGAGTRFLLGLVSSDINKVVVKMTLWNKVYPASPYLDDALSGADEGPMRVGSTRSVDYLQIFAVGVFVRRCSWLSFVGVILIPFFDLFFVKFRFLQPAGLVMTDCKPVLLRVLPQSMFFQRLLDLVVSSGWFLRSSKPCVSMTFAGAPFPCCLSSAFFKLRWTANFERKKTARVFFNVILFYLRRYVSRCLSLVLPIVFLDMIRYEYTLLSVSLKKNINIIIYLY
jgi:hypothetical protein